MAFKTYIMGSEALMSESALLRANFPLVLGAINMNTIIGADYESK
jgi:hypothetical protein